MGCLGLNQEQLVAMPCNLVRMLQLGVQRDVPNFSRVRVQEEELCWSCPRTMVLTQSSRRASRNHKEQQ
eukprot:1329841-Pleurochrysis_carterae.AAC.1